VTLDSLVERSSRLDQRHWKHVIPHLFTIWATFRGRPKLLRLYITQSGLTLLSLVSGIT